MTEKTFAILPTFAAIVWLASQLAGTAAAQDPKVPPADDPGGVAIGLTGAGIDYTDPDIATGLARDGEGNIVGWDFVDNDIFPYAADAQSNGQAKLLLGQPGIEIIPFRIGAPNHVALASAFLAQTPAGILVVTTMSNERKDWDLFVAAAGRFPELLILVPAGNQQQAFPATLNLPNVLAVSADANKTEAADIAIAPPNEQPEDDVSAAIALAAALAISCKLGEKSNGAERKAAVLKQHTVPGQNKALPVFKPCS